MGSRMVSHGGESTPSPVCAKQTHGPHPLLPPPPYNVEGTGVGTGVPRLVLLYYNRQTGYSKPRAERGGVHSVDTFSAAAGGRLV